MRKLKSDTNRKYKYILKELTKGDRDRIESLIVKKFRRLIEKDEVAADLFLLNLMDYIDEEIILHTILKSIEHELLDEMSIIALSEEFHLIEDESKRKNKINFDDEKYLYILDQDDEEE